MFRIILLCFIFGMLGLNLNAKEAKSGCLNCHSGIENIKNQNSDMMKQIKALGLSAGDPNGCIVCHGGNPKAKTKIEAHKGAPNNPGGLSAFVRDPGSIWIADKTCGLCHSSTVDNMKKSLMMTEAGKIQGNLFSWGSKKGKKVVYGNYKTIDKSKVPTWGTKAYKEYMKMVINKHPYLFPKKIEQIPSAPMKSKDLKGLSEKKLIVAASLTYQRGECQRCHIGVSGSKKRGDYRGMGCSACHIPYSNEGYYEGKDKTINKHERGHLLVHMIQASRKSKVTVHHKSYSGISPETCNSCHNRGKRIGVSYMGLMESAYNAPLDPTTKDLKEKKTHGKRYLHISSDVHFKAGMTCQDCHTSIDMHGDGNIAGTTLAAVEIECEDCHGNTKSYPWELPLGYGENIINHKNHKKRALAEVLPNYMTKGTVYKKQGGYLLTTRGNPFGNVVKVKGKNKAIIHLASGKDLKVPLLKEIDQKGKYKTLDGAIAMSMVDHTQKLECYTCHATWAPQCYGCHIKVDYSKGKKERDWLASVVSNSKNGETLESKLGSKGVNLKGKVTETRSYLRWENPILGINGENRISPLIPGCQTTYSIIDQNGKVRVYNRQSLIANGADGELVSGTNFAPVQPHTIALRARACATCHMSSKALGYGVGDNRFFKDQGENTVIDLINMRTGKPIAAKSTVQFYGITIGKNGKRKMNYDWDQILTRDGEQLQSVGLHWVGAHPLDKKTIEKIKNVDIYKVYHDAKIKYPNLCK